MQKRSLRNWKQSHGSPKQQNILQFLRQLPPLGPGLKNSCAVVCWHENSCFRKMWRLSCLRGIPQITRIQSIWTHTPRPGCSKQKYVHQDFWCGQSLSVSSRSHVEVVACQHRGNQKLTTGSWLVEGVSFKCAEFLLTRDLKLLHIYIPLSIRVFLGHILPIWINCCNSNLLSSFLIFLFFSELPIFGAKKKAATTRNDGRLLHKMSMSPSRWMYRQTRKKNVEKLKRWGCHFFLVTRCFHWVWGKSSHGVQELSLCNLLQQHQGSSAGASILLWKVYTNLRISMPASPTPYPS